MCFSRLRSRARPYPQGAREEPGQSGTLHAVTLSEGFAQLVDAQGPINGPKGEREGKDWRFCNAQTQSVLLHDLLTLGHCNREAASTDGHAPGSEADDTPQRRACTADGMDLCQTQDLSPMSTTQEAKFGKPEGSALTRSWLPSSIFPALLTLW
jgi:hypothetical protein